jgi:hypothetical protein
MLPSPQVRLAQFRGSGFAGFLLDVFQDNLTRPSQESLLLLALGWVMTGKQHRLASYLWHSGASEFKHFGCFYTFLERSIYPRLEGFWCRVVIMTGKWIPEGEVVVVQFDDTTRKKSGREIEGTSYYRNGAAAARQERKSVFGLNFVLGVMRVPLAEWLGGHLPVPIGLALYLKEKQAEELARPYQTRSALARAMLERVVSCLPDKEVCSVQDGAYATKAFLRERPEQVQVVSRMPVDAKLYGLPVSPPPGKRGPKPKKGDVIGSAKSLVGYEGWQPHPHEEAAEILVKEGIWHSVLPGVVVRVVFVRRAEVKSGSSKQLHKRPLEAFFSTDVQLTAEQILAYYQARWTIEIAICASVGFYGLAQDGCRKFERIVAINSLRLLFAAAQLLWFIAQTRQRGRCKLRHYRPWYRHKLTPSLGDAMWACRESLYAVGITPTVGFWEDVLVIQGHSDAGLPRAA